MIRRRRDYPKELKVKDTYYQVLFVSQIPGEPADTIGLCCSTKKKIWIKTGQSPKERFKCFLHETAHAIEFEYGFDIPHATIYKLEEPILKLILDNAS